MTLVIYQIYILLVKRKNVWDDLYFARNTYTVFLNQFDIHKSIRAYNLTVCFSLPADVGGGMALKKETDNEQVYYLRGIVSNGKYSNGNYNACENFYTMFTNVLEYLPFIKAAIEDFP